jgi:hypothetical protein
MTPLKGTGMDRIEEIRARVAEIASAWPNQSHDDVEPYIAELNGYTEEIDTASHPDAGELLAQIDQLTQNITQINGAPEL